MVPGCEQPGLHDVIGVVSLSKTVSRPTETHSDSGISALLVDVSCAALASDFAHTQKNTLPHPRAYAIW